MNGYEESRLRDELLAQVLYIDNHMPITKRPKHLVIVPIFTSYFTYWPSPLQHFSSF